VSGWETRSSREVYANAWIRVLEDETIRPDGSDGLFGVVEVRQPAVFVVAVTDADEIVLVTIDRYTTGTGVEVPAGSSDEGEAPEATARRELREETGYTAERLTLLGRHWANNGVARAQVVVFLARGLSMGTPEGQEAEGITGAVAYPWPDVRRMLRDGTITDSESVGALMLAAIELELF
jgi:8-oxo-dGDP phosphatase